METLRCHHCNKEEPTFRDKQTGRVFCCRDHYMAFGTKDSEKKTPNTIIYTKAEPVTEIELDETVIEDTIVLLNGVETRIPPVSLHVRVMARKQVFPEDIMLLCHALDITKDTSTLYVPSIDIKLDKTTQNNMFLRKAKFGSLIRHHLDTEKGLPAPYLTHLYNKTSYTLVTPKTVDSVFNLMSIMTHPTDWSMINRNKPFVVALTTRMREAYSDSYATRTEVDSSLKDLIKEDDPRVIYSGNGLHDHVEYTDRHGIDHSRWPLYSPLADAQNIETSLFDSPIKQEKKMISIEGSTFRNYGKGNAYHMLLSMMKNRSIPGELVNYVTENLAHTQINLYLTSLRKYAIPHLFPQVKQARFAPDIDSREVLLAEKRTYVFKQPAATDEWKDHLLQYLIASYTEKEAGSPLDPQDKKILAITPYITNIIDETKVSIVMLEKKNVETMQGYVTCSLLHLRDEALTEIKTENVLLQNIATFSKTKLSTKAFYHIFHIDGLHVLTGSRSIGAARLLVYHALRFIDSAASDLGVTLVTCDASAYPTYRILKEFGFTHYNELHAIEWIIHNIRKIRESESNLTTETALRKRISVLNEELLLMKNTYTHDGAEDLYVRIYKDHMDLEGVLDMEKQFMNYADCVYQADELFESIEHTLVLLHERITQRDIEHKDTRESFRVERFIQKMVTDTGVTNMTCLLYLDNKIGSPFKTALAKLEKEIAQDNVSKKKQTRDRSKYTASLLESLSLF